MSMLTPSGEERCASPRPHDVATRSLHWATAGLVLTLYGLSLVWDHLPKGGPKHMAIVLHMSLGVILTSIVVVRIAWRLSPWSTAQSHEDGLRGVAARTVHLLLYVLLGLQVLSGWNFRWAQGEPLSVFGLLIAPPMDYPDQASWIIGLVHYWTGTAIIALSLIHIAAALFHHYVLGDDVIARMLPNAALRRPAMPGRRSRSFDHR